MFSIKLNIAFISIAFLVLMSCSKETEEERIIPNVNLPENLINDYHFAVGNHDSATYYLYQPSLDLTYVQNFPGFYTDTDSFDIDFDNTYDIALKIEGYADNFVSTNVNYVQLDFLNLNGYEIVCDSVYNNIDTLNLGDTLNSNLNWINRSTYLLWYTSPMNNNGNWGIGYQKKYIGFRSIANDTIMGWISLKMSNQQGVALRIEDCAIETH